MNIIECLGKGYLKKINPDFELAEKEIKESKYDLEKAKKAFKDEDYKWCIIKAYYSMFHASKSVLFKLGYSEKRHIAVLIVLEDLERNGEISSDSVIDFKASMTSRQDADYHYSYSKEIAEHEIKTAKSFLEEMEGFMKKRYNKK
jgi:uncharacterized protein (UPF0332 family)